VPRKKKAPERVEPVHVGTMTAEDMAKVPSCLETIVWEAQRVAERIEAMVAQGYLTEAVEALNAVRSILHGVSPFKGEPVDLVTWLPAEKVMGYDEYKNPNTVAAPEMALLRHSMAKNGVAVAIVTHETDDGDVTVDGMHRRRVGSTDPELRARLHGYLPVSRIRTDRADVAGRIAATVEFNRARGEHGAEAMSALVRLLYELGWTDERIQQELGMQLDEVVRLKQITGIAALFADREFSPAWEPV
jgi:ParB-like chromosome segregation protein Spo0J